MKNDIILAHELDLKSLGLNEGDLTSIHEIKNSFGELNSLSVAEFGKDISKNNKTSDLLKMVSAKDLDTSGEKLNEVIMVAKSINSSNVISNDSAFAKLPLIGHMFKSVDKARTKFQMKFNDTEKQINSLINEIEVNQGGLKSRVELLDSMFDSVTQEYRDLGIYIAAGRLKLKEIQEQIAILAPDAESNLSKNQEMYDLNHVYNNLEKRLHDLYTLQQSSMQTLPMIRLIQSNSTMLIDKFYAIKNITIPAWRNQLALAISLDEQKNSVALATSIDNATNDLLKRNADLLHRNSIDTAKANQRSIIDVHVLEYVQNTLIKTVDEVIQIQKKGISDREQATIKLAALQDNYKRIVSNDTLRISQK